MSGDLKGRVALVTGSTTGIGKAIAESLARRGAAIVAHGKELSDDVLTEWQSNGWRAIASSADLADPAAVLTLIDETCELLGPPDILVLNASLELSETVAALSEASITSQLEVNVTANALLLRSLVPKMGNRGWGRVIAIGSVQEERPNARHLIYAGTKAALTSMILNLARTERSAEVTFNVVRPGAIVTDRNRAVLSDASYATAVMDRISLGRLGVPSDCAGICAFLCSRDASYINGAVISVDGGLRL